jgi:hypothetical protein
MAHEVFQANTNLLQRALENSIPRELEDGV